VLRVMRVVRVLLVLHVGVRGHRCALFCVLGAEGWCLPSAAMLVLLGLG
jgi:hypothetical protein